MTIFTYCCKFVVVSWYLHIDLPAGSQSDKFCSLSISCISYSCSFSESLKKAGSPSPLSMFFNEVQVLILVVLGCVTYYHEYDFPRDQMKTLTLICAQTQSAYLLHFKQETKVERQNLHFCLIYYWWTVWKSWNKFSIECGRDDNTPECDIREHFHTKEYPNTFVSKKIHKQMSEFIHIIFLTRTNVRMNICIENCANIQIY